MRKSSRLILGTAVFAGALVSGRTSAQTDVNPPAPNVMLLVDSSGSMEYKSSSTSFPACDPTGVTASEKSRWVELVEVISGSIDNYRCAAVDRTAPSFASEFAISGTDPADYYYTNPYHRPLSTDCTPGPGTLPVNAYDFLNDSIKFYQYGNAASACAFAQQNDGLLDDGAFRNNVRFGLMTFDTSPGAQTGVSGTTANAVTGVAGTWSYFWGSSATGKPAGCSTDQAMEVGARNAAAPPWEGRMVGFGGPTDNPTARNDRIQKILTATRPYGATPIAGMLDDARDYLWNDTSKDPLDNSKDFGPFNDPYIGGGCRKNFIILMSDGEPNLDLRPYCEGGGPPAGTCPYDKPEVTAWDLANAADPKKRVQTFVIGFAVSNVTLSNATPVDCKTLSVTDLTGPTGLCATNPNEKQLQACCTLSRIAYNGGTSKAYFANNKDELRASLSSILSGLASKSTSRTLPVFASSPGGAGAAYQPGNTAAAGYRFFSSFEPKQFGLWSGVVERQRFICNKDAMTNELTPVPQDIDKAKGDDFVWNVNSGKGPARTFMSVQGATVGNVVYSTRSIRPALVGNPDGVGSYGGTQYQGDAETFNSLTSPESMGITGTTCAGLSALACRDRYMRWLDGADKTSVYTRCKSAGTVDCNLVGDIYHSTPRIVGRPSEFLRDESYQLFALRNSKRHMVMYTSTNDGFFHGFKVASGDPTNDTLKVDSDDNNELFAFIPPAVLPAVKGEYPPTHQTLLDGVPVVQDVVALESPPNSGNFKFERSPTDAKDGKGSWRTIMVQAFGGTRSGYFAIDVTDPVPSNDPTKGPKFLWQLTEDSAGNPLFGRSSSTPLISTVFVDVGGGNLKEVAVAVLPGGDDPDGPLAASVDRKNTTPSNVDAAYPVRTKVPQYNAGLGNGGARSLTIVRLDTGEVLRSFRPDLALAPPSLSASGRVTASDIDSPITGTPVAFPGTTGAIADRMFVGDRDGTLWRVDLASTNPSSWTMKLFFDLYSGHAFNEGQPMMTPPVLSVDAKGNVTLAVSTGDQDILSATLGMSNYVWSLTETLTVGPPAAYASKANWYTKLLDGERVTGPISLFNGAVFFSSYKPEAATSADVCGNGASRVWGMDYLIPKASGDLSQGGKERLPNGATIVQYIDDTVLGPDTIIFGVGVAQLPSCTEESSGSDQYFGTTQQHTSITNVQPGKFQLVMHTGTGGTAVGGGKTKRVEIDLPTPPATAQIDSWAAIVE